ncbi:hypothetical protein Mgra_00002601 [Meloidogyne graminicola]|uniref:Uncharacterized protein n=1 Tax=Meloidogyne graminicola TaxID=189291 RepID=A0A8S9ZWB3_9BILA|nr:hypothetical protein Mgra_00002601 [Meloidogyne graminicola]
MFRKIKKVLGPIFKSAEKISFFQLRAVKKADRISKGEKTPVTHYPREEKYLKEISTNLEIKEKINKKYEELIKNTEQITITSTDPPEIPKSKRDLPKRDWEYSHGEKLDYEYGFYEPPVEKLEENRLMFREALEILRARMELESVPEDSRDTHQASSLLKSHPAVKRIQNTKLDTMWNYFRPFAVCKEQNLARRDDLEEIKTFIEGYGARQLSNPDILLYLQKIKKEVPLNDGLIHDSATDFVPDFKIKSKEKTDSETERLENTLRDLFQVEKPPIQSSSNKKD